MNHAQEPWTIDQDGKVVDAYGFTVFYPEATDRASLTRIIECVNACEGSPRDTLLLAAKLNARHGLTNDIEIGMEKAP